MADSLFSPNWFRVAKLKPRLRAHAEVRRHQYRGETWYVLRDRSQERYHRFSPSAWYLMGLMDGVRTVEEVWTDALRKLGDDAVSQDETITLLGQLHSADVLQCDVPPDTAEIFRRREKQEKQQKTKKLFSIFAWQIRLFDPERFLNATAPLARPFFTRWGFLLWLLVVGGATVLGLANYRELTESSLDRLLAPSNLFVLWLLFPLVKVIHEFGHAYAVKSFGGEVHEMGVMILVLTPVPYVDASSSWAFRSKWQRIVVGGAGMMVELVLASAALVFWLAAEPGVARSAAFNVIVIAGVSTVLFNANPLLRFDGYYMLMDWLEIPNLRSRSTQYFVYLAERYLFGRHEAEQPNATTSERAWFVAFGVFSFLYRITVVIAILVYLGQVSLILGVVFATATAFAWLVLPLAKIGNYLFTSPRIRRVRRRAQWVTLVIIAALGGLLFGVPVPLRTQAEGVMWIPEEAFVRAGTDCFIDRVVAKPGSHVEKGDLLVECTDIDLATEAKVLEARLKEVKARWANVFMVEPVKAQIVEEERRYAEQELARAKEKMAEFEVRAKVAGEFVFPRWEGAAGRFVKKGELIAHVVDVDDARIRTIVGQKDIDLVRNRTRHADVRLAEKIAEVEAAEMKRIVPAASDKLPSPALGVQGGGAVAVDPSDREGRKSVERYFQVDVVLAHPDPVVNVGGRAYVRFDHGLEPLGFQWYRRARQLFLARFNV